MQSADGKLILSIPRGTKGLTRKGEPLSEIMITEVGAAPTPPAGSKFIGLTYDLQPDGATFDPPITLTFTYNPKWIPAGLGPEKLTIGYYNATTKQWVMLDAADITIDPATNTVSAKISHFTYYSVMAHAAPAKFTVSGLTVPATSIGIAEKATISAMVTNTGDVAGTYVVTLKINGKAVSSESVKLAGGEAKKVTFTTVQGKAGSYKVEIDGQSATFTVKEAAVKPVVIAPTVPSVSAPSVAYPAPTAPVVPAAPAPVPAPTPWLAIILSLVVTAIVAGIVVWYFSFRRI